MVQLSCITKEQLLPPSLRNTFYIGFTIIEFRPISTPPARDTTNEMNDSITTDTSDTWVLAEWEVLDDHDDDDEVVI